MNVIQDGTPIEILLVEGDPGDVQTTRESLEEDGRGVPRPDVSHDAAHSVRPPVGQAD